LAKVNVLAVDVGIRTCGYVICELDASDISVVTQGEVKPKPKLSMPEKLGCIFDKLCCEIENNKVNCIVVERLYSHYRHPTTLGVLAQVRGVVALIANKYDMMFYEFSPTRARKSFLGKGNANSMQVKKMAEQFSGHEFASEHIADAFSLAVALSHELKVNKLKLEAHII
jgi:crossover junction endodeoxyribonuclease RuvC